MEDENFIGFFAFRGEYRDELYFGCRVNNKDIYFYPIEDTDNHLIEDIAIHSDILKCSPEEIAFVNEIYLTYRGIISLYFELVRDALSYPYPRRALEEILRLDLTETERGLVFKELDDLTYIYLIKDNRTGLTKIGRSKTPLDRLQKLIKQDTLMPQENDFTMLFYWEHYNYLEGALHRIYESKRVRGEWFNLTDEDIEEIKKWQK